MAKAATADGSRRPNPAAYNLGLDSQVNERSGSEEHYYELLLESLERLFDNEIEQHVLEDQMTYMFGTKVKRLGQRTYSKSSNLFQLGGVQDVQY